MRKGRCGVADICVFADDVGGSRTGSVDSGRRLQEMRRALPSVDRTPYRVTLRLVPLGGATMRRAPVGDRLVRALARALEGDGRVGVAVDHERRDRDVLEVLAEVGRPERLMQASAAFWPDWWQSAIASWRCCSVTLSSSPAVKNCVVN
jgi:hypothetical protein